MRASLYAFGESTLIIAGGGTGGHVAGGIAIADAWREKFGAGSRVVFVGAKGGVEEKMVPKAGYPLRLLKLGSLNRVSFGRKLLTALELPFSFFKSILIIASVRPRAVIGVGGYASGPLVLVASAFTKTAILEQNAVPGFTNRLLARFVGKIFCAFSETRDQFGRYAYKAVTTGNPTRSVIKPLAPAPRDPFTVFIFGGSQGAVGINTLVLDALEILSDLEGEIRFIHQTGEKDFDRVSKAYAGSVFRDSARIEKFIHDMSSAYAQASLVICRAGSSTLAELAAAGRAAILIPLPFAADNHQEKNARILVDAKAALILPQLSSNGKDLVALIRGNFEDTDEIARMEEKVRTFYDPDAARKIAENLWS